MKKTLNTTNLVIEIFIIWFIFQAVLASSLLKFSDHAYISQAIIMINYIARICLVVFGIYYFSLKRINKSFIIPLVLYAFVVLVTIFYNHSYQFFDALFIAFFFKDAIEKERLINLFFWTLLISVLIVILLNYFGFFPFFQVIRADGRQRLHLGFVHPNSLGFYVMILCFLLVLRIKEIIRIYHIVIIVVASFFLYIYPNSYTSAICVLLLAVYLIVDKMHSFLFKSNVIKSKFLRYGSMILVPVIILSVYWFVTNASNITLSNDYFLSSFARIRLGVHAIQKYGIHLFGLRNIEFIGTADRFFGSSADYFVLDCFYILMLVRYGIVTSFLFFVYYILCLKACLNEKDSTMLAILLIMAFYSITESMILAIPSSFIFIISSGYLWNSKKIKSSVRDVEYKRNTYLGIRRIR